MRLTFKSYDWSNALNKHRLVRHIAASVFLEMGEQSFATGRFELAPLCGGRDETTEHLNLVGGDCPTIPLADQLGDVEECAECIEAGKRL